MIAVWIWRKLKCTGFSCILHKKQASPHANSHIYFGGMDGYVNFASHRRILNCVEFVSCFSDIFSMDKISQIKNKNIRSRLIPAIITVLIVWPLWGKLVSIFPNNKEIEDKIEAVRDYSDIAKLDCTGLSLRVKPPLKYSTNLSEMLKGSYDANETQFAFRFDANAEVIYRKVIENYPKFPFPYFGLAVCLKNRGDPNWKPYAEKAGEILKKTTSISGHEDQHDQVLERLQILLNEDVNKSTKK